MKSRDNRTTGWTVARLKGGFTARHWHWFALAGVLLLGMFFRFWQLAQLPPGLHPDEAANGLDVFRILEQHDFRPLYDTNGPRESLFFYIQAVFVMMFGNTAVALRYGPALIGSVAVLATFAWVQSWFGRRAGLVAAFLLAVTPWGVTISRDGFRASMLMLMVPLALWLYTRGFQTGRNLWFGLAGVSLGAGFYTYLAWRLFPLALGLMLVYLMISRRAQLKRWARPLLVSLGACAVVLTPLGIYAAVHPADIFARTGGVSVLNPDLNHGQPFVTLMDSTLKTALMFNFRGDTNFRQNYAGYPELNWFVGGMFIIGILVALVRLGSVKYFGLMAVFLTMLLPAVLTAEGIPHALRSIGALVPALALAAVGIGYVLDRWRQIFTANQLGRWFGFGVMYIMLGWCIFQGYHQYFVAWAGSAQTYGAYSEDAVAIANFLNVNSGYGGTIYTVVDGYSDITVQFLTHNHSAYTRIDPDEIARIEPGPGAMMFVVGRGARMKAQTALGLRFPGGVWTSHYSGISGDVLYFVYQVGR